MSAKSIAKTIGKHAPLLGSLLGGKAGEQVGSLIASAFGVENKPSAIDAAIAADPEASVKLRQIELEHKEQLEQIQLNTLDVELKDKQNARQMHQHNPMPMIICISLTLMVAGGAYLLFTQTIPASNEEIAYLLFGTLLAKWGDSIAYWVGTTRSSAEKDRRK